MRTSVNSSKARGQKGIVCYLLVPSAFRTWLLVRVAYGTLVEADGLVNTSAQLSKVLETHGDCGGVGVGELLLGFVSLGLLSCCGCWVVVLRAVYEEEEERKKYLGGEGGSYVISNCQANSKDMVTIRRAVYRFAKERSCMAGICGVRMTIVSGSSPMASAFRCRSWSEWICFWELPYGQSCWEDDQDCYWELPFGCHCFACHQGRDGIVSGSSHMATTFLKSLRVLARRYQSCCNRLT